MNTKKFAIISSILSVILVGFTLAYYNVVDPGKTGVLFFFAQSYAFFSFFWWGYHDGLGKYAELSSLKKGKVVTILAQCQPVVDSHWIIVDQGLEEDPILLRVAAKTDEFADERGPIVGYHYRYNGKALEPLSFGGRKTTTTKRA